MSMDDFASMFLTRMVYFYYVSCLRYTILVGNPWYIFVHVSVYVYMCRHVYVYEYDCFMCVHVCTVCICIYFITMYSTVRILLVSDCTIQIRFIIIIMNCISLPVHACTLMILKKALYWLYSNFSFTQNNGHTRHSCTRHKSYKTKGVQDSCARQNYTRHKVYKTQLYKTQGVQDTAVQDTSCLTW